MPYAVAPQFNATDKPSTNLKSANAAPATRQVWRFVFVRLEGGVL